MNTFKDKICVITGAGSGIGRALALQFAESGAKLALADKDQKSLDETKDLTLSSEGNVFTQAVDVADKAQMQAFADAVEDKFGGADIVINNAGVALIQTVEDTSSEDFEWLMGINFWGVVYGSQMFLPMLKRSNDAALVNISSVFGLVGIPTQGAYNASKFAVKGFTEALRLELKDTNVTPISVHPGGIKTNISRSARFYRGPNKSDSHSDLSQLFDRFSFTTPEKAASTIIKGIKRKKLRVLVGKDAYVFDWASRLLPSTYHKVIDTLVKSEFN